MRVIGTDINGNDVEAVGDVTLLVTTNTLVKLNIPSNYKYVHCQNNLLTEIDIPLGVEVLSCQDNQIKELKLPSTLRMLYCDAGLFDYDTCEVENTHILYVK
jgi:hypothetical protein